MGNLLRKSEGAIERDGLTHSKPETTPDIQYYINFYVSNYKIYLINNNPKGVGIIFNGIFPAKILFVNQNSKIFFLCCNLKGVLI